MAPERMSIASSSLLLTRFRIAANRGWWKEEKVDDGSARVLHANAPEKLWICERRV
jgi:hypothetical protein